MTKKELILKYFQKTDKLTVKNKSYRKHITSLFNWMLDGDNSKNDITSQNLNLSDIQTAQIISKEKGIMAGIEEISYLLEKSSITFLPKTKDQRPIAKDQIVAEIKGKAVEILGIERTILNILQRMSGIATETDRLINILNSNLQPTTDNLQPFLAATRKTPWMLLDKKAVAMGGGLTHRLSLSDGILIKDNHLKAIKNKYNLNNNSEAIKKSLEIILPQINNQLVEVEVEDEKEALIAVKTFQEFNDCSGHCEDSDFTSEDAAISTSMGLLRFARNDIINHLAIMFDNFPPDKIRETIDKIKHTYDTDLIIFEASGGITSENIQDFASCGVDIISLGSLTHSVKAFNFSMEFE